MPVAAVIVPVRNAEATLGRTLAALAAQDFAPPYEVLVVDDGSSDASVRIAQSAPGPVRVLRSPGRGPADARNAGVRHSEAAYLAFCDADVVPTRGWLRAGVAALAATELVQGHVLPDPAVPVGPFDRTIRVTGPGGLWEAASLFVTRELFERTRGFRAPVQPRGKPLGEDVQFGYEARRLGARGSFCAEALSHHAVFPRGAIGYAAERARLRYFPAIARAVPELRCGFLYRRWFLDRRSARFDLAVLAAGTAVAGRSPLPLVGGLPYLRELRRSSLRAPGSALSPPAVAAGDLAADLVGLTALIAGSVRYRAVVL